MMTTTWISSLPDIPRILTAFAEWLSCFVCILAMRPKMNRVQFTAVSLFFLGLQSGYMVLTDGFEGLLWNLCMLGAVLLMYGYFRVCTQVPRNAMICCCASAFITAEFAASFAWQVWCYIGDSLQQGLFFWRIVVIALVFIPLFLIIWKLDRSIFSSEEELTVSGRELAIVVISAVLIFAVSNLGFFTMNLPFAGRDRMEIFNVRTLVDLGGVAILYAYQSQWRSARIQRELAMIQAILNSQYEQYKQAQRAVDMINYRYHDLKNHIIALRADGNDSQRRDYLDKLEQEIHDYEALNKTGNQVLDTLLTSKRLRCMKHKIDMTCVIDGTLFDFMDVMDICSIFGNALDNAIESQLKIKDYSRRTIHVDAFSEKSFLIIRFENYFEGDIHFAHGMPVTTKSEKSLHGYGLKSLLYTVHKYKGEVQIGTEDNWFSLRILIPRENS